MLTRFRLHGLAIIVLLSLTLTGCFGLFTPAPSFEVEGVEDGEQYSEPVTPVITAGKGTTLTITLNDDDFESDTEITEPGDYELVIVGENSKGKTITETIEFTILSFPIITITGVEDGGYYDEPVTPVITTDGEDDEVEITLNDEEFTSGTEIDEDGEYTLKVVATNIHDITREVEITFEVNQEVSAVVIFEIDENLTGFTGIKADLYLNEDSDFIITDDVSLKYETEEGETKHEFRIHRKSNYHPNWPDDWSPYDKFSFYVFIEDLDKLNQSTSLVFELYTPDKNEKVYTTSDLSEGWNPLIIDLQELLGDNINDLEDMGDNDDIWLNIIIRSASGDVNYTAYFDDFRLYMSEHYNPEDS